MTPAISPKHYIVHESLLPRGTRCRATLGLTSDAIRPHIDSMISFEGSLQVVDRCIAHNQTDVSSTRGENTAANESSLPLSEPMTFLLRIPKDTSISKSYCHRSFSNERQGYRHFRDIRPTTAQHTREMSSNILERATSKHFPYLQY